MHATFCSGAAGLLAVCHKSTQEAAMVWYQRNRAPPQIIPNCKFLIHLLDTSEEYQSLSNDEL
jgi:hypothetical protein